MPEREDFPVVGDSPHRGAKEELALAYQIVAKFGLWAKQYGKPTAYGVEIGILAYGIATLAVHSLREAGVKDIISEITMEHLTHAEEDLINLSKRGGARVQHIGTKVRSKFTH